MCTGNMPDPAGVFNGKIASLPDPLNVHTPTPQQKALDEAKQRMEQARAEGLAPKPEVAPTLKIERKQSAVSKKRSARGRAALRIDLQSPGSSSAGGPPTIGAPK